MPVAGELTLHLPPVALKHQQFISGFISWVCGFSLQVLLLPPCEQLFRKLYNRDFQDGGGGGRVALHWVHQVGLKGFRVCLQLFHISS